LASIAKDVQLEMLARRQHSLQRRVLDDLRRAVDDLLPLIVQVAAPNLAADQRQLIETALANAKKGESVDPAIVAALADAFNSNDAQLRDSGLSMTSDHGPVRLTWMEFVRCLLDKTRHWCEETLNTYGASASIDEQDLLVIDNLKRVSELLGRQLQVFNDPKNLPYHHENLRSSITDLINNLVRALQLSA
jgi:hypothetical protein